MYYLIIFVIAACVAYSIIVTKKAKGAMANVNMDEERKKAEQYQAELLTGQLSYLQEWVGDAKIDAFTTATVFQTKGDKLKQAAKEFLKSNALKLVGIKTRYVNVESYVVLCGDELHFVNHDADGDLDQHIIFGRERLENAVIADAGVKKPDGAGADLMGDEKNYPHIHIISMQMGDDMIANLEVHDRIKAHEMSVNVEKAVQISVKYQVVGELLLKKLLALYPNLQEQLDKGFVADENDAEEETTAQ